MNLKHLDLTNLRAVETYVDILGSNIRKTFKQSAHKMADEFKDYIVGVIDSQSYKWKELNPGYKKWKANNGLDTRILLATHFYRDHIRKRVYKNKITIGVDNIKHPNSNLMLPDLAHILEYGTIYANHKSNVANPLHVGRYWIPPRPLWRPAVSVLVRRWNEKHKRNLITNLKKAMSSKSKIKLGVERKK